MEALQALARSERSNAQTDKATIDMERQRLKMLEEWNRQQGPSQGTGSNFLGGSRTTRLGPMEQTTGATTSGPYLTEPSPQPLAFRLVEWTFLRQGDGVHARTWFRRRRSGPARKS